MIAQKAARIAPIPALRAGILVKSKHSVAMKNIIANRAKPTLMVRGQFIASPSLAGPTMLLQTVCKLGLIGVSIRSPRAA